jgi:hypothetical protein
VGWGGVGWCGVGGVGIEFGRPCRFEPNLEPLGDIYIYIYMSGEGGDSPFHAGGASAAAPLPSPLGNYWVRGWRWVFLWFFMVGVALG